MQLIQASQYHQGSLSTNVYPPDSEEEIQTRIAKATEAFLQGTLIKSRSNSGNTRTINGVHEIPSLIRRGFILRHNSGTFFISHGQIGGAPIWFSTTKELVKDLRDKKDSASRYSWREAIALKVIDMFGSTVVVTEPMIDEVTELAFAGNKTITKHLLIVLLDRIEKDSLLNFHMLQTLKATLINSSIGDFNSDQLIKILQIVVEKITNIHAQEDTREERYVALSTISDILDVMSDANVFGVDRADIHAPLYDSLDKLSRDSEDILLAAQAAYAKQALIRVPNNETAVESVLRHGQALVQGVASLYDVVANQNLSSIIDAYNNFKEAAKFVEKKKLWYGFVRILKLISEKLPKDEINLSKKFTDVISKASIETSQDTHIIGNILFILHDIARYSTETSIRGWALEMMLNPILNNFTWGIYESKKQAILDQLTKTTLSERGSTPTHISLITVVQRNGLSVDQKLEKLKEETLQDLEILKEIACYIPVQVSREISTSNNETFDLDHVIDGFFTGKQKVFLLLGDSGGGKSTYLRCLEHRLWKEWKPGKPIPLFISLLALKSPFNDAIKEALNEKGFNDADQNELKIQHSFIFLMDGYDELKQKNNLYESNKLKEWKAKTIITCRTQYLIGDQSNYKNFFAPRPTNFASTTTLEQAYTSPFTKQQIEAYCRKFIKINNIQRTWDQYNKDFKSVLDLEEMIENPFFLKIIIEILPSIIENYQYSDTQQNRSILIDVFDAFVKNWFDREEYRILETNKNTNIPNLKKRFADFATRLAQEMVHQTLVSVDYEENSDKNSLKWEKFFGSDDETTLIRSGVPLRKIGSHSYAFIHKAFLEYFSARSVFIAKSQEVKINQLNRAPKQEDKSIEQKSIEAGTSISLSPVSTQNKPIEVQVEEIEELPISFDNINKTILTNEPEIIHLMAECIRKDPTLIKVLFEFIERSKDDPQAAIAAANAITVLNVAQVNLSRKDFRRIKIPNADLSNAILTSSDFSDANLENVHLNEAVLDYAIFARSKTNGLELGQKPILEIVDINSFAISPDSESILFGGKEGKLYLLNLKSNETIEFRGHQNDITSVAFSLDGKSALTGSKGKKIRLWDCRGKVNHTGIDFKKNHSTIKAVFAPDGSKILSSDSDNGIRIWDLKGNKISSYKGHNKGIIKASFISDSNTVISAGKDGSVCQWDCMSGTQQRSFNILSQNVSSLEFSSDGKWWFSSSDDHIIRVWNGETGKEQLSLIGHTEKVTCIASTADGSLALSGSEDHTVRLWDRYTGKQLVSFVGHSQRISNVAFSPDEQWAFSQSDDGTLRTWNLHRTAIYKRKNFPFIGQNITIDRNGASILLDGKNNNYHLWDLQTGKKLHSFNRPIDNQYPLALASDRKSALFGSEKGTITLWDCDNGNQIHKFNAHKGLVTCMAISPDGNLAISGSADTTICLLELKTGKHHSFTRPKSNNSPHGHSHKITCVAFSPNNTLVASSSEGKSVRLWNCDERRHQHSTFKPYEGSTTYLTFSPDGTSLLTGGYDGTVKVWEVQNSKCKNVIHAHSKPITQLKCNSDCSRVISASLDNTVCIWENGIQHVFALDNDTKEVKLLPDVNSILVTTSKPTLQLWELFNNQGQYQPFLVWTSGHTTLSAKKINIQNVIELSETNQKLFNQLK